MNAIINWFKRLFGIKTTTGTTPVVVPKPTPTPTQPPVVIPTPEPVAPPVVTPEPVKPPVTDKVEPITSFGQVYSNDEQNDGVSFNSRYSSDSTGELNTDKFKSFDTTYGSGEIKE